MTICLTLLSSSITMLAVPSIPAISELECLATNIYMEARGEPAEGQVAVAKVTLNRATNRTICAAVYQKNQFSWTNKYKGIRYNYDSVNSAVKAYNDTSEFTSTHYHTLKVKPSWRKGMKKDAVIGNHIFYTNV